MFSATEQLPDNHHEQSEYFNYIMAFSRLVYNAIMFNGLYPDLQDEDYYMLFSGDVTTVHSNVYGLQSLAEKLTSHLK